MDRFVAGVLREEGRIDCLVNNAGLGVFGPVDELTGEQWREVIETNLSGYFYFLRAVAPAMKRAGRGLDPQHRLARRQEPVRRRRGLQRQQVRA